MKITKEVQIAFVAILGIAVLFFGLQFLKGLTMFSGDDNYYVRFNDVSGLSVSSPVYANGYRVGVVEDVIFDYEHQEGVVAVVGLDKKLRLPKGSVAKISSDMMGNLKLELMLGTNLAEVHAPGDTISGVAQQGMMDQAAALIPTVESILPKLDSILANVNALLADPALSNSLHHVDAITAELSSTSQELHRLSSSLNKQMPRMLENADGVLANANEMTRNLNDLDIAATMNSVNATLKNVEQMTAKLNSNDGTLGLLMRDGELYRNLTSTMLHTDSLMIDLKQHPKRYVHFSIFGKKDK